MSVVALPQATNPIVQTDVEKLQEQLSAIGLHRTTLAATKNREAVIHATSGLVSAVKVINEIIMNRDNAKEFCQIGGLGPTLELLNMSVPSVIAATAEMVADLTQNDEYCQTEVTESGIAFKLNALLEHEDSLVTIKALYAISCICRGNDEALKRLEEQGMVPNILQLYEKPLLALKIKSSFFLRYLVENRLSVRTFLHNHGYVRRLCLHLCHEYNLSQEYLLHVLLIFVENYDKARRVLKGMPKVKEQLEKKLAFFDGKDECMESKSYVERILALC